MKKYIPTRYIEVYKRESKWFLARFNYHIIPAVAQNYLYRSIGIKRFSKFPGHSRREFLIVAHLIHSCLVAAARSPSSDVDYSSWWTRDLPQRFRARRVAFCGTRRRGATKPRTGEDRGGEERRGTSSPSRNLYVDAIVRTVHGGWWMVGSLVVFVGRAFRSAGAASTRLGWWFFDDVRKSSNTHRDCWNANPATRGSFCPVSPLAHPWNFSNLSYFRMWRVSFADLSYSSGITKLENWYR